MAVNNLAIGAALVAIALWSALAALGSLIAHVPPFLLVGVALGIGALPSVVHIKSWFASPKLLAFGSAGIFGYHFLLFSAFRFAPVLEANLINYLWPALIVVFSGFLLRGYRLTMRHAIGCAVAFAGACVVLAGKGAHFEARYASGYALAFLAAVVWALYSVLTKKIAAAVPSSMVGGFCFASAVASLACHAVLEPSVSLSVRDWIVLGALGLGPMGAAFYAWDYAFKKGDPRTIGLLSYLTPVLSMLFVALST